MASKVYPHGSFRELAPGVWTLRGISGIPLHRNMVVVRLPSGGLVLHSVVALDEEGFAALLALGKPEIAIVPSRGHQMDAPLYKARFPNLRVICPAGAMSAVAPNVQISGTVEEVVPTLGWIAHKVPGVKIDEFVYELPLPAGGRMLMANDTFGGAEAAEQSLRGVLVKPMMGLNGLGIPRIVRWRVVNDMAAVRRFAGELAKVPDLRLMTVAHGEPVLDDPVARLRAVAA
jgi:hypothetical protein